jgi:hypothetical protein
MIRAAALLLAAALALPACGRGSGPADTVPRTTQRDKDPTPMLIQDSSAEAPLPHEPGSMSELLAQTEIFTVEITAARPTPWARAADGLEHRKVALQAKVAQVWKGSLRQGAGQGFEVEIEQRRMGEGLMLGYLGLWSHVVPSPEAGVGYLVLADGALGVSADAAALLQEGPLQRLFAPDLALDVHLAKQAEKVHAEALRAPDGGAAPIDAARAILAFAAAHRAEARDVFGRYLWARLIQLFAASPKRPLAEALSLMTAPDATAGLRAECVGAFDRLAPVLAQDRAFLLDLGRALAALVVDPTAAVLRQRVVTVSLYFLVFPDEAQPRFQAAEILPDAAARARAKAVVESVPGPRGQKLAAWLSG